MSLRSRVHGQYKYHYDGDTIVMKQPIWRTEDKFKEIPAEWIDDTDLGCYPECKPKNVKWYLSAMCDKPSRWGNSYWTQKDQYSGEPLLFLLPCNAGVIHGNYFKGGKLFNNMWRNIELMFRDLRDEFCLAAVDCLIYCSDVARSKMPGFQDGKGAIVFEWEMDRVKSEVDEGIPTYSSFQMNANQPLSKKRGGVLELADYLMVGLDRVFNEYKFKKIYAHLSPLVYRCAFCLAVERLQLWDKVCVMDFRSMMTGVKCRNFFRTWHRDGADKFGIYDPLCLHALERASVTEEFYPEVKFWNYSQYYKDWNPRVYQAEFRDRSNKKIIFVREEDASIPIPELQRLYNVWSGLKFQPSSWKPLFSQLGM